MIAIGEHGGGLSTMFWDVDECYNITNLDEIYDPIFALTEDVVSEFYDRLSHLDFSVNYSFVIAAMDPHHFYSDYVVKVTYTDGAYDIISRSEQSYFSKDSELVKEASLVAVSDFEVFIKEYLPNNAN